MQNQGLVKAATIVLTFILGFVLGQMMMPVHPLLSLSDDAMKMAETRPANQNKNLAKNGSEDGAKNWPKNWIVRCGEKPEGQTRRPCEMVQSITMQDTGQRLVQMALTAGYSVKDDGEVMDMIGGIVMLPLGIQTEQGVVLRIDEAEQARKFPIESCAEQGCQARIAFSREDAQKMAQGQTLSVVLHNEAGKVFVIPMPLSGFGDALQEMQAQSYAK